MDVLAKIYNFFFASYVWGIEDGKQAGSMFTRAPEGGDFNKTSFY